MNRVRVLALCAATALLAACATEPMVRTRVAEQVDLASFHTYAFVPKPGTDAGKYKSLTTQQLERDVGAQLQSRGYLPAQAGEAPDLLVDFKAGRHDRVEGSMFAPAFGGGWGWGWGCGPYGGPWGPWGWGGGGYYNQVQTVTTVSLTVELIQRADQSVVWSGTAISDLTHGMLDHPARSIDEAVHQIFVHFPVAAHH